MKALGVMLMVVGVLATLFAASWGVPGAPDPQHTDHHPPAVVVMVVGVLAMLCVGFLIGAVVFVVEGVHGRDLRTGAQAGLGGDGVRQAPVPAGDPVEQRPPAPVRRAHGEPLQCGVKRVRATEKRVW